MTAPAPPAEPGVSPETVIAAAAIGLALIAVETRVRQEVQDEIETAMAAIALALAAAMAAALLTPGLFVTATLLFSDARVHATIRKSLDDAERRASASIQAGYKAAALIALARARRDLGDDVPDDLPELDTTLVHITRDVDTMFRQAETDLSNTVRDAYDGVQGDDAATVRPIVVDQAITAATNRLHQRAGAAAATAVGQGASDTQQAIWAAYQNTTGAVGLLKRWVVTASDPCGTCAALHGTTVALNAEFDHDLTNDAKHWRPVWRNLLGPPRHPNCRCQLELVNS